VSDGIASCSTPKVAFAPDGTAHVIWYQTTDSGFATIRHAQYIPGLSWTRHTQVSINIVASAYYPEIGVDGSGNAVAV
jgi:hypothetical protein